MPVFWVKRRNIGRLSICLGRNDSVYNSIYGYRRKWSTSAARDGRMIFLTFRIGTRFLNIDIV